MKQTKVKGIDANDILPTGCPIFVAKTPDAFVVRTNSIGRGKCTTLLYHATASLQRWYYQWAVLKLEKKNIYVACSPPYVLKERQQKWTACVIKI